MTNEESLIDVMALAERKLMLCSEFAFMRESEDVSDQTIFGGQSCQRSIALAHFANVAFNRIGARLSVVNTIRIHMRYIDLDGSIVIRYYAICNGAFARNV